MLKGHRIGASILMGGSGRRFGSAIPKQFHRLAGQPVFLHTLEAFLLTGIFDEIVLSCHSAWTCFVKESLPKSNCFIQVIEGGATRQESSFKALLAFEKSPAVVVIHDAVRPFVSQEILLHNAILALEKGAVNTCIPSADTIVYAPGRSSIAAIPKRSDYWRGQTPQSFAYQLILNAHRKATRQDVSDDCGLVLELGHPIAIQDGDEGNIKITSELDLILAEHLLQRRLQSLPPVSNKTSIAKKCYAIIGGLGGIGGALMHQLRQKGAAAFPLSRRTDPPLDLNDLSSIEQALQKVASHYGLLDGLINCAGHLLVKPFKDLSLKDIENMLDVNLKGLIYCCKLAHLKEGAHIVNIASSSFSKGRKDAAIYSSAKAAVVNFTQGLAEERPDLRIHAIIPQRTNTALRRQNYPQEDLSTLLEPKHVAEAIVRLLEHPRAGVLLEIRL